MAPGIRKERCSVFEGGSGMNIFALTALEHPKVVKQQIKCNMEVLRSNTGDVRNEACDYRVLWTNASNLFFAIDKTIVRIHATTTGNSL